jgi:hypothetical protein
VVCVAFCDGEVLSIPAIGVIVAHQPAIPMIPAPLVQLDILELHGLLPAFNRPRLHLKHCVFFIFAVFEGFVAVTPHQAFDVDEPLLVLVTR